MGEEKIENDKDSYTRSWMFEFGQFFVSQAMMDELADLPGRKCP